LPCRLGGASSRRELCVCGKLIYGGRDAPGDASGVNTVFGDEHCVRQPSTLGRRSNSNQYQTNFFKTFSIFYLPPVVAISNVSSRQLLGHITLPFA